VAQGVGPEFKPQYHTKRSLPRKDAKGNALSKKDCLFVCLRIGETEMYLSAGGNNFIESENLIL
jgi:hypothetical protein